MMRPFNSITRMNAPNPMAQFIDAPDPIYGTGFHGDAVLDGGVVMLDDGTVLLPDITNTFYGATTDLYFNNLTINSGIQLRPDGYRIFVKNLLTLNNNSRIGFTSGFASSGSIAQGGGLTELVSLANSLGGSSLATIANLPLASVGGANYYKVPHQAIRGWSVSASSTTPVFLRGGAGSATALGGGVVIVAARYMSVASGTAYISAPGVGNAGGGVILIVSSHSQLPSAITTDVSGQNAGTVNYMQLV